MKIKALALATSLAVMTSQGVQAASTIGFVDITYGKSKATSVDDGVTDKAGFYSLSGAAAIPVGAMGTVIFEGETRRDSHEGAIVDGDDMKSSRQLGTHYLHDFGGNKLGAFLAYADAKHAAVNEDYSAIFGGIEVIVNMPYSFTLYGQGGSGDENDGDQSSEGYKQGKFVRVGVAYSGIPHTLLKLDHEEGKSAAYEDLGERGAFKKSSLMGETGIPAVKGLTVTYGISRGEYDAKRDPDLIEETSYYVGIRYYFGGATSVTALKSGLIGLPSTPMRSMAWVPALD